MRPATSEDRSSKMIDLIYAGSELKKVAYSHGIRTNQNGAWFRPVTANDDFVKAIVGDNSDKEISVTQLDLEYAAQYTWEEVRAGRL